MPDESLREKALPRLHERDESSEVDDDKKDGRSRNPHWNRVYTLIVKSAKGLSQGQLASQCRVERDCPDLAYALMLLEKRGVVKGVMGRNDGGAGLIYVLSGGGRERKRDKRD